MGFVIVVIVIVALYVWYKTTHYNDSKWVKERIEGRTDEQKAVIRYFCNESACLSKKPISDDEYDRLVAAHLSEIDFKQKALNKIGLDEDQVKEIEPVHFEGYQFGEKARFAKLGKDGLYRSSQYQVSWLFFSDTQVYVYQNTFNMDEDGKRERTEEYFYKDITNFSTTTDTEETPQYDIKKDKTVLVNVDSNRFVITVPGDRFYCSLEQNDYTESAIQGMKAKLREKKSV
jgi:hypothetical protein